MAETAPEPATVHATAVLLDGRAVVVRGPSGAGKSRLALRLIAAAAARGRDAALIGDDRVVLEARGERLVARVPERLAGWIEVRGIGVVAVAHEPAGVVRLVVDLVETAPARMPEEAARSAEIGGVRVARLALWRDDPAAVERVETALAQVGPSGNLDRIQVRT